MKKWVISLIILISIVAFLFISIVIYAAINFTRNSNNRPISLSQIIVTPSTDQAQDEALTNTLNVTQQVNGKLNQTAKIYLTRYNGHDAIFYIDQFTTNLSGTKGKESNPQRGILTYQEMAAIYRQEIDFGDIKNSQLIYQDTSGKMREPTGFAVNKDQTKIYLMLTFKIQEKKDGRPEKFQNKLIGIDLSSLVAEEIWLLNVGEETKYEGFKGNATILKLQEPYAIVNVAVCKDCDLLEPGSMVVINLLTSDVKVLGPVGNIQLDESKKTISYQKLEKTSVFCDNSEWLCFDNKRNAYKPLGETSFTPLP